MQIGTFRLSASLILVGVAIAEDLPPEILLLSKVKRHIQEELRHLPNISCVETVQREYQPAKGKMRPLDTIRLEVLTNGDKDLFASPGDRRFSERHPISFAGSGVLGTGVFGSYLRDVLFGGSVCTYKGQEEMGGHRLARYDYRMPVMWSGQTIQTLEGSGRVGYHGSYWADLQTYDVTRLEVDADDFPPSLPVTEATTTIDYVRTRLGENLVVLLPQSAEFRMVKFSGQINHNRTEFTHCRAFGAESTINFGESDSAEQVPHFAIAVVDDSLRPLRAGLQIAVKLRSRITSDLPVGTLIDGIVAGDVVAKKGAVVIKAGSPVRGRIRRLERYAEPFPHFIVALEFTEVELLGIRYRFYADVVQIDSARGVEQVISTPGQTEVQSLGSGGFETRQTRETLRFSNLPGVATFFFAGGKLDLPGGFRTVWKTLPPVP